MSKKDSVSSFVSRKLKQITCGTNPGMIAATLAKMRRGLGKAPGDVPELWGVFLDGLPEEMQSRSGEPTREEWAVYIALTMFALHQQGHDPKTEPMHMEGRTLGEAIRALGAGDEDEFERARGRFNVLATSESITELAWHLKSIVTFLRAKDIPLDYGALAADLYLFQWPDSMAKVRLRWGQQFYRAPKKAEENTGESNGEITEEDKQND